MAQFSQLFLFDSDPSGLDTLTYGLEKDGRSVLATGDPAKARELVQANGSSLLVLVHLRAPEQVGLDLLRSITSNPRTRNLACIAIGAEESRAAALAAGAFVFLSVPLFVRDIVGACRLVAAATVPGSRPSPDTELSLKLSDVEGVYFLVRSLAVTGRSAVVELRRGAKRAELRFIDGVLTSADVGPVQGLPALHHLLLWDDAEVRFKFRNVVRRGTQLSMKSNEIIDECDRFLRDFAHEVSELGVARTVYASNIDHVKPSAALPSEVVPVLRQFDGHQDLAQVLDDSPFRIFDTIKIIKRFVADGAISLPQPLASTPVEVGPTTPGPAVLDVWLQRPNHPLGSEIGRPATSGGDRSSRGEPRAAAVATAQAPVAAGALADALLIRSTSPGLAPIITVGATGPADAGASGATTNGVAITTARPEAASGRNGVATGKTLFPPGADAHSSGPTRAADDAATETPPPTTTASDVAASAGIARNGVPTNGVTSTATREQGAATGLETVVRSTRPSSPFSSLSPPASPAPVAPSPSEASASAVGGAQATDEAAAITAARPRTITRKEHAIKPPIVVAVDDIVTPPPPASVADVLTKPASSAARGEITVGTFAAKHPTPVEGESIAPVPSVVVELEPLSPAAPTELARAALAPAPASVLDQGALGAPELARAEVPQQSLPAEPAPARTVAVETVIVEAALVEPALVEPAQSLPAAAPDLLPATVSVQAASAAESAPSVIVSPLASEPNLAPPAEALAAPVADAASTSSPPPAAATTNHVARTAAIAFSDVEADFFNREADLYKRDSVETFDDLDRKPGASIRSVVRSGTKR